MRLLNRKRLAFWAAAVVLFAMVTSGGCGGSTSNNFVSNNDNPAMSGADSQLAGVWRFNTSKGYNDVSADVDGTRVNLSVLDFVLRFQSVDVEDTNGELYVDVIAILSSDRVIIPLAVESIRADTAFIQHSDEYNSDIWSVQGRGIDMSMELSAESDPDLTLLGGIQLFNGIETKGLLDFKKVTASANMTNAEMNSLINGTWQTPIGKARVDGGFTFTSGDIPMPSGDMPMPERHADMPLIEGMHEIDSAFANYVFEETDTASGKTIITTQVVLVTTDTSGDLVGSAKPFMMHDYEDAKITPMYDKVYKIELSSLDKAVLVLGSDYTNAYLITSTVQHDENGGFIDTHAFLTLEKKPDAEESTFNIAEQIGSVWTSTGLAAGEIRDSSGLGQAVKFDFLGLMFPAEDANLVNRSFKVRVLAEYHDAKPENVSAFSGLISLDIPITYIERIGYNSWYADTGNGITEGDNRIIITALNNYVLVTAFLQLNGKEVSIVAFMSREGDMEDIFFSGAWQCFSKDAAVHFTETSYFDSDVTLLNFGAKFSSVDIDAGTGYLSAVAVLSSDLMLIPMVFDNEKASVDIGSSAHEYIVTTQHGTFIVTASPKDNAGNMNLQGNLLFPDTGLTVSLDATLTRVTLGLPVQQSLESEQLDFAQIMNGSTWQTTPFASQSGGFAIAVNSIGARMYPAIGSKTFANIVFDGNTTGGTISGFGMIGLKEFDVAARGFADKGTLIPITMIKQKVDVSNVLGNFYRFELASGDQGINGVFILESETDARMIMYAETQLAGGSMRIYSMFTLHKVTETQTIGLAAFNNTSWDVDNFGGFALLPPDYAAPYSLTKGEPAPYSVAVNSWDVSFTDADLAKRVVTFDVSMYVTVPAYNVENRYFRFIRQVEVEHVGAYTWYGKTTGEDADGSEFLLTMSAAMPNRAALAGNINFEAPTIPGTYTYLSVLLDAVLRQ